MSSPCKECWDAHQLGVLATIQLKKKWFLIQYKSMMIFCVQTCWSSFVTFHLTVFWRRTLHRFFSCIYVIRGQYGEFTTPFQKMRLSSKKAFLSLFEKKSSSPKIFCGINIVWYSKTYWVLVLVFLTRKRISFKPISWIRKSQLVVLLWEDPLTLPSKCCSTKKKWFFVFKKRIKNDL